jgi:hypothetical protein
MRTLVRKFCNPIKGIAGVNLDLPALLDQVCDDYVKLFAMKSISYLPSIANKCGGSALTFVNLGSIYPVMPRQSIVMISLATFYLIRVRSGKLASGLYVQG